MLVETSEGTVLATTVEVEEVAEEDTTETEDKADEDATLRYSISTLSPITETFATLPAFMSVASSERLISGVAGVLL